ARPPSGEKHSCIEFTAPHDVPVVDTANNTLFITPNLCSLPSINGWTLAMMGFGCDSAHHARAKLPTSNASITPYKTRACFKSPTINPNAYTNPAEMMSKPNTSQKLLKGVGFSNGCALFCPKNPPPFVPSCLMATCEAAGPVGIDWVSTFAS